VGTSLEGLRLTHYEVLGVETTASRADLRSAYVRLARTFHPDFHADAAPNVLTYAQDRMREVNIAWQVLSDEAARHAYDQRLGLRTDAYHGSRI